jgi:hypothetical protein
VSRAWGAGIIAGHYLVPHCLIRHNDGPAGEKFLHIAVTETQPEMEPDAIAEDLDRKPVVLMLVGR